MDGGMKPQRPPWEMVQHHGRARRDMQSTNGVKSKCCGLLVGVSSIVNRTHCVIQKGGTFYKKVDHWVVLTDDEE